jgi:hypothetical protein
VGSGFKTFTAGSVLTASDVQNYLQDQAVMVFGGTAARSSAIGTANFEEGMLTYLTDVDKLQVYTGSSFQDVYPPAATSQGMTLINTTSFSGVSSQAVTSIFSSTYKNYKIILNITSVTSDCSIFIKMRSGATDSSASYTSNRLQVINGTVSGAYGSPETNGFFIFNPDTAVGSGYYNASIDLSNPFESLTTTAQVFSVGLNQTGSYFLNLGGTLHELSNSYDSLNVLTSAGNMTGSIRVYGYNQ